MLNQREKWFLSCLSSVGQNPFFYLLWWFDSIFPTGSRNHNRTCCSIMAALHSWLTFHSFLISFPFVGENQHSGSTDAFGADTWLNKEFLINFWSFFCHRRWTALLVWGITSLKQPHPFLQGLVSCNISVSVLTWCLFLTWLLKEQLPLWIRTAQSFLVRNAGWHKRTLETDVSFFANPNPTQPPEIIPHPPSAISTTLYPDPYHPFSFFPCSPLSFQPSLCIIRPSFTQMVSHF